MIHRAGDRLLLEGDVSFDSVEALLPAGSAMFDSPEVVIDLGGVTTVDSSAIALLLAWMRTCRAAGRNVRYVAAPAALLELARLYGVTELLHLAA